MKTLTIISPVYNEAEIIDSFYTAISSELEKISDYQSTILFVVDKGSDNTLDILKKIARKDERVRILALSSRFGHQMSLLAGIDVVDSDVVIMMDSDLEHPPELIPRLLEEYEKGNDVVHTVRKYAVKIGLFKKTTSYLFYRFFNFLSEVPLNEGMADFRLISHKIVLIFQKQIRERNMFLRGLVKWVGFKQITIPYISHVRTAGVTKYSLLRLLQFGALGAISFSKKPLRIVIFVGIIFSLLGFFYAIVVFYQFFIYNNLPPGWATLIILLSIFSGIQLICLGIIGEYVGLISDEIKHRPHYIVEEKINF